MIKAIIDGVFRWRSIRFLILFCINFLVISNQLKAQIPRDTLVVNGEGDYALNEYLYYLKKTDNKDKPELILSEKTSSFSKLYPKKNLDIGLADSYYWLAFTVKNAGPTFKNFYFKLNYPVANLVTAYSVMEDSLQELGKTGSGIPFYNRSYVHADAVFELSMQAGTTQTFLIMIDKLGESFSIQPELVTAKYLHHEEQRTYIYYGIIVGIMLANIIINIFLYLSLKQNIHLFYSGYVFAMMFWILTTGGMDYQFIFYNWAQLPLLIEYLATGVVIIFMSYLIVSFLTLTKENSSFLTYIKIIRYVFYATLPLSTLVFTTFYKYPWVRVAYLYLYLVFAFLAVTIVMAAAAQRAYQKYKPAWLFLASLIYLVLAIIQYILSLFGMKGESSAQNPNNIQIGILFETVVIFLGIIYRYNLNIKEKRLLEIKVIKQNEEKSKLILEAQEEERKRLAEDLHDDVGATLSTLVMHVSNLPSKESSYEEVENHNKISFKISKKALSDLRLISHNLLPADFLELGLNKILNYRVIELNNVTNINFVIHIDGDDAVLSDFFSITIYRIINELFNNVIKHSQATFCRLELITQEDKLTIIFEDDGIGLDKGSNANGIGLKNIKSRVEYLEGILNIDSNTKGTVIILEIPIKNK